MVTFTPLLLLRHPIPIKNTLPPLNEPRQWRERQPSKCDPDDRPCSVVDDSWWRPGCLRRAGNPPNSNLTLTYHQHNNRGPTLLTATISTPRESKGTAVDLHAAELYIGETSNPHYRSCNRAAECLKRCLNSLLFHRDFSIEIPYLNRNLPHPARMQAEFTTFSYGSFSDVIKIKLTTDPCIYGAQDRLRVEIEGSTR